MSRRLEFLIWLALLLIIVAILCVIGRLYFGFSQATTYQKYAKNVIYCDFSQLSDNLDLATKTDLPFDLLDHYKSSRPKVENRSKFEAEFWQVAQELKITQDQFKTSNYQQALLDIVNIIGRRITYFEVDLDPDFIKTNGAHLPIDRYFYLGRGDCDKYRDLVIAAFDLIKPLNPNLVNVYLLDQNLGGNIQPHAWVAVLIAQSDRLIVSHIDPTFYDNGSNLEADTDYHVTLQPNIFLSKFYYEIDDYNASYSILEDELNNTKDLLGQQLILVAMSRTLRLLSFSQSKFAAQKISTVISRYQSIRIDPAKNQLYYILYDAYFIAKRNWDKNQASAYLERLKKEFPDSYWLGLLQKEQSQSLRIRSKKR